MTSLLHQLLDEQQDLTAVERFSQLHGDGHLPEQERYYSRLLPSAKPTEGQQYAFHVDLDKCSGCKACVTACHSLNGLDEDETWRDVGLLIGGSPDLPVLQHVTTACHHCVDPACAAGCPVNAYEKDPVTGIVRHLDDQCFGCQYCTMTCPYEVPQYSAAKGIVRKCDMCSDRLADGEAPACVQACPHEAIAIEIVNTSDVTPGSDERLVATAPKSEFTRPTTTYTTSRGSSDVDALVDHTPPKIQHAHRPLIVMLVLSQMSVGMFVVIACILGHESFAAAAPLLSSVALVIGLCSIAAATLHLGRPQFAFRAILGFTHSWLSREIVAFGAFAGLAAAFTASTWLSIVPHSVMMFLCAGTAMSGLIGVTCSVMIYVFTRREFWNAQQTGVKFFLSTVILGCAACLAVCSLWYAVSSMSSNRWHHSAALASGQLWPALSIAIAMATLCKLSFEAAFFRNEREDRSRQIRGSQHLMNFPLRKITVLRFAAGITGGILCPIFTALMAPSGFVLWLCGFQFTLCLIAETCERYLFFAAVAPDRMPGGLQA